MSYESCIKRGNPTRIRPSRISGALKLAAIAVGFAGLAAGQAIAADKLIVGKAVPQAFSFTPVDIGVKTGIFAKNNLDIEIVGFHGDAKMQQAAAAGSIDILLGSGPAMAFIAKGAPVKAVAAMAGPPLLLAIVVRPDGPKSVADMKGKKVGVSTRGSLTYFLVSQTSFRQGWGPDGIDIKPMGAMPGQVAALKRGDLDGVIMDVSTAYKLAGQNDARILIRFTDMKDFMIHVIYATNKKIAENPKAVANFLKGWFETIKFMREKKAETVKIAGEVIHQNEDIMNRTYDEVMPMFSADGKFDAKALEGLKKAWVALKLLPTAPDPKTLYTEAYLPK